MDIAKKKDFKSFNYLWVVYVVLIAIIIAFFLFNKQTTKTQSKLKVVEKYFCSDVCPLYGRTYHVYEGIETRVECAKIGGTDIVDSAWGGYIGCGPKGIFSEIENIFLEYSSLITNILNNVNSQPISNNYPVVTPTLYISPILSPTPKPTILLIPDYGPVNTWKLFINTKYGYSIRYPQLSSYEATATEEYPSAQTNLVVNFISNDFLNDESDVRLFPWQITVNGKISKSGIYENEDFVSYINYDMQERFKFHTTKPKVVNDTVVDGHRMLVISNQKTNTNELILYAVVQRDESSYIYITVSQAISQVIDGDVKTFIQFINQFLSTLKFIK